MIVLPYGDRHVIGGESPAELRLDHHAARSAAVGRSCRRIRHGGGGARVDLVCGYLHSEDPLFDPALRVFPPAFVVRLPDERGRGLGAGEHRLLARRSTRRHEPERVARRRCASPSWCSSRSCGCTSRRRPRSTTAGSRRLHDPVLAPALALLHGAPERRWTVAELAAGAAVSRSMLDERFRHVLGRSPIRYLTEWRMHLAEDLLATTDSGVAAIARRVGYDSEEAFSRAFKRAHGASPSHWRVARHSTATP